MKSKNLTKVAQLIAAVAHQMKYPVRWGVYMEGNQIIVFNNWPHASYPEHRHEYMAEFQDNLRKRGIKVLAVAAHPETGYTYAMILEGNEALIPILKVEMAEIMGNQFPVGRYPLTPSLN